MGKTRREVQACIEDLLAAQSPSGLLASASPFSADFWKELESGGREATRVLLDSMLRLMQGISPAAALANAWAVALSRPEWIAWLARSVDNSDDPTLLEERARLLRLTRHALKGNILASTIYPFNRVKRRPPPDLRGVGNVSLGLRVRYSLAHAWALGASTSELLSIACSIPGASTTLRTRELLQAVRAQSKKRRGLRKLTEAEFSDLPPRVQAVALGSQMLADHILPEVIAKDPGQKAKVFAGRKSARASLQLLWSLRESLEEQDLVKAEVLLQSLEPNTATLDQARIALAGIEDLPLVKLEWQRRWRRSSSEKERDHKKTMKPWDFLSPTAVERLGKLAPQFKIPFWWTLSPSLVAQRLAKDPALAQQVPECDMRSIQMGWGGDDHALLLSSGIYGLVPIESHSWEVLPIGYLCKASEQVHELLRHIRIRIENLPDARSVLALLKDPLGSSIRWRVAAALDLKSPDFRVTCWAEWTANCIGTTEWNAVKELASKACSPLKAGLALMASGVVPVDVDGFTSAVGEMLAKENCSEAELVSGLVGLNRLKPASMDTLIRDVPLDRLVRLGHRHAVSPGLSKRLVRLRPELRDLLWSAKLSRVKTAEVLRDTLLERPDQWKDLPWQIRWLELPGEAVLSGAALVLAARRSAKKLNFLRTRMSEVVFAAAARTAADWLPAEACRERGFLRIVAALGGVAINSLKAVMIQSNRAAPPGCKLDGLYHEYQLPKKSGGTRVISVPARHLKQLQSALLERVFNPLGAHDAAFGFVPKRSILANATVHTGQRVVANVDVHNCFPSVKWSLVLGALRRDLGSHLGQEAVSILVDICTSKGGLPIGAPTSPALLNRVLLRTDEVLHAAALARNCRYTRYADDMTFSGDHRAVKLLGVAKRTLSQIGLTLDDKKTSIYRPGRRQMVTGLVVNQKVSVPRRIRRRLRAAVHAVERGMQPHWHGKEATLQATMGRLAFVCQIHPEQGGRLKARWFKAKGKKENPANG